MSLWLLLVVGVALGLVLLVIGVHMIRPSWSEQGTRADVGVAVVTTTVISLAIFVLQILDENRLQREDAKRQDEAANQSLRLQLGLSSSLRGMDLHGRDLRDIVLPQKNLRKANFTAADLAGANFEGAHLEGAHFLNANLAGADLSDANLEGADLRGADVDGALLDRANLANARLNGARLTGAELYGANFGGANASGSNLKNAAVDKQWNVTGLQYDAQTVFPNGKTYSCSTAPCILKGTSSRSAGAQR